MKEKEITQYVALLNQLKKQNYSLQQKLEYKEDFARVLEMEGKLKEAERKNQELMRELKVLQRIQSDQGKALEKITNDTENPQKVKQLAEEVRIGKERTRDLEEKLRKEERSSMQIHDYMIKMEETCRDLKNKLN